MADYQIVNGCQTSHVLFDSKDQLGEETHVPLKVISTDDEDIISAIITATNRQTEVTADDLYAMSAFQKRLEALYAAYPNKKKLYYERRSKQYASVAGVEKVPIIGKTLQVRAFAAMFLDDPHRAADRLPRSPDPGGVENLQRFPQIGAILRVRLRELTSLSFRFEIVPSPRITSLRASISSWHSDISLVG